jgi:4-hydroxy-2-oxoheptanedioate aldolase
MRTWLILSTVATAVLPWPVVAQSPPATRLNPIIELLAQKQPVFGLYAPSNRRGRAADANAQPVKTTAQLAAEALAYRASDFIFDGTMEGNFERAFPLFAEFVSALSEAGALQKATTVRLSHPLIVKMHEIAPDPKLAAQHISQQLNLGVSGIVFVGVESAEEVETGLAAMRFTAQGGTRPDAVDRAPAYWGLSHAEYRQKADLWPLNPSGELINWTIVESKEGLARVREIAAVKGIGVLFPGAGTLRGVFTTTDASGQRVFDEKAWEAAIQQVLAACKEFNVPCGYPANANDIELRMKQGFSVFIMNWGEAGFRTIDIGRRVSGRPAASTNPR